MIERLEGRGPCVTRLLPNNNLASVGGDFEGNNKRAVVFKNEMRHFTTTVANSLGVVIARSL